MISIIASHRAKHQVTHQEALAEGLSALGISSILCESISQVRTKYVACWGWRLGKKLRDLGHEVLVMERGYIGDRFKYTSLGWNGLNGHAEFPEYPKDNGERFREHGGEIKPWKEGRYALILGQVPKDASLQGKDLIPWYRQKAKEAKEIHGIDSYFRQHPDCKRKGIRQLVKGTLTSRTTLQEALEGAKFTIAYNSNSCVDSILAGVPCVAGNKGTMAWDMCGKSVSEIITPEREEWAYSLAWKQWSIEEIRSGYALKGLVCRLSS